MDVELDVVCDDNVGWLIDVYFVGCIENGVIVVVLDVGVYGNYVVFVDFNVVVFVVY